MHELKKADRITQGYEYRRVYQHGRAVIANRLVLYVLPRQGEPTRVGFVTGKKVGNAVARNRARRLLREAYRLQRPQLKPGYHLVLVGRKRLAQASYAEAERDLLYVLRRAKLLQC